MKKIILVIIIVFIVVFIGLYFLVVNLGKAPLVDPSEFPGMKVEILKEGTGPKAKAGDVLTVNELVTFEDGRKFFSSADSKKPLTITIGDEKVTYKSISAGVTGMQVGEQRKLTIPPQFTFGSRVLIYDIEVLKIN